MKEIKSVMLLGKSSKAITLPKNIQQRVKVGKRYLFDVKLIEMAEVSHSYKCKVCGYKSEEKEYCPFCQEENKQEEVFE